MKEAAHYSPIDAQKVECRLCPHRCKIAPGHHGICLTRKNIDGTLYASNYCRPASTAVDPIEKKPLFHFYPGSAIFSTGPYGCTLKCGFCQNYELSQKALEPDEISVKELLEMVIQSSSIGIAYTYSEPTIWFETIMELGPLVRARGLKNVMVTNGYIETAPLQELLQVVDAMNIDIKSMEQGFYQRICKGSLAEVLRTCETVKKAGCHVEITNLLIPGENDSPDETRRLADFIASALGKETPLHFSRYFPRYKMDHSATPSSTLTRAWEIARAQLEYVYIGNNLIDDKMNTFCPQCNTLLISRQGYDVAVMPSLSKTRTPESDLPHCSKCNHTIAIVL